MRLTVAGNPLTTERAVNIIGSYARNHVKTLDNYDGRAYEPVRRWRAFVMEDIEAAKVIERGAIHPRVADAVLEADLPWEDVPGRDVDLGDLSPKTRAYGQLTRFYLELKSIRGVGPAVATKMMYLRWPAATPIQDSLLADIYRDQATAKYAELRTAGALPPIVIENRWRRLYTLAVRDDLLAARASGAMVALRDGIITRLGDDAVQAVRLLSDCRLIDILAWSLSKGR